MKKHIRIGRVLLILGVMILVGVAAVLGWRVYKAIRQNNKQAGLLEPLGDAPGDFEWEGDYIDTQNYSATMSIEKKIAGSSYDVTITWSDVDREETVIWSFTGRYDDLTRVMNYEDGSRKDMITDENSEGLDVNEVYSNAEGYLYLKDNDIYWKDGTEDFGEGMVFSRVPSGQEE